MQAKNTGKEGPFHAEDLAWKSASAFFGDELIHWLGIGERAVRAAPTELVELEVRHMYEDFLYEMDNGMLYHFEFESDAVTAKDLKRFREYEAATSRLYDAPVITYVICSSRVKNLKDHIREGINTYRVKVIRLKDENADEMLELLAAKPSRELTREELFPLLFTPLMNSETRQLKRIRQSIHILKKAEQKLPENDIQKMEAILYILAGKFLKEDELAVIKEEIVMTKLGQMIWDDAIEKGREEGERIGREAGERIGREAGERIGREAGERIGREAGERIGREAGERIGREQASERYSRLILTLNKENKTDQIIKVAADPEYREALYREYGI